MTGTSRAIDAGEQAELLGIYLNDHLAGATGGIDLARRAAGAHKGSETGQTLERLAQEIAEDRDDLVATMRALDVPVRSYKVYLGWAAEKVGRLKTNGHLLSRSPLSSLVELEGLSIGINGKIAVWRTLRVVADRDTRLDATHLDRLLARAHEQLDLVEALRVATATEIFGAR